MLNACFGGYKGSKNCFPRMLLQTDFMQKHEQGWTAQRRTSFANFLTFLSSLPAQEIMEHYGVRVSVIWLYFLQMISVVIMAWNVCMHCSLRNQSHQSGGYASDCLTSRHIGDEATEHYWDD